MSSRREERKKAKMIEKMEAEVCEYNKVKKPTNVVLNVILTVMSLVSILPFIFVIIISLTDEQTLAMNGYQFIPEKLSLYAYHYIISAGENILRSYGVTILVTVAGTIVGLFLTGTYAYALSRKTYAFHYSYHHTHAVFRRYGCQLSDRDQGADAERFHMGADSAPVSEYLQCYCASDFL